MRWTWTHKLGISLYYLILFVNFYSSGASITLRHGEGIAFDLFHAKHVFEVAGQSSSVLRADWNGDCLEKATEGCPSLKDEYSCLASVDGRNEDPYHKGLKAGTEFQRKKHGQTQTARWLGSHASGATVRCATTTAPTVVRSMMCKCMAKERCLGHGGKTSCGDWQGCLNIVFHQFENGHTVPRSSTTPFRQALLELCQRAGSFVVPSFFLISSKHRTQLLKTHDFPGNMIYTY